jgi:uncharacterized protein YegJ (DUF2314 family)
MKKTFRNMVIVGITLIILTYVLIVLVVSKATEVISKEKTKMESYIGKKYVMDSDTIVVTDFSYASGTVKVKFKDKSKDEVSTEYLKTLKEVK